MWENKCFKFLIQLKQLPQFDDFCASSKTRSRVHSTPPTIHQPPPIISSSLSIDMRQLVCFWNERKLLFPCSRMIVNKSVVRTAPFRVFFFFWRTHQGNNEISIKWRLSHKINLENQPLLFAMPRLDRLRALGRVARAGRRGRVEK